MAEFTTGDGVRLHYDDEGAGDPIVLVAGFRAAATSWFYQRQFLLDRGFRVIAFDRRSHGLSEDPAYGHRMARHGRDLAELLEATGLVAGNGVAADGGLSVPGGDAVPVGDTSVPGGGVVLVGGSMGASTIWSYLDLFGTQGLRAVVTIDQTPKMSNEDGWDHGFYGYGPDNLGTFFAAGPPDTGRGTPMDQRGPRLERLLTVLNLQAAPGPLPPTALALLRDHAVQDWRDVVGRIDIPALFVAGRDSELWPCEHAVASAALNPLARSVVIEDCGHAANVEQPEVFNAAVLEFLPRAG